MISFKNVNKWYGELHVLNGIDLEVAQGEVVVVCGPSGSGKSTLIRCINRLEPIQKGELVVDNMAVHDKKINMTKIRAEIGFVFQSFNLISFKNAMENVALPLYYQKVNRKKRNQLAMEYLDKMGLADWAHHLPNELSGGQKQRLAIARALISNPKVILADEPTGALDTRTGIEIMSIFQELNRQGMTVVVVTHEPEIASFTKRYLLFRDGLLVKDQPTTKVADARNLLEKLPKVEEE